MEAKPTYEELEAIVVQLLKDNVMLRAQLAHLLPAAIVLPPIELK